MGPAQVQAYDTSIRGYVKGLGMKRRHTTGLLIGLAAVVLLPGCAGGGEGGDTTEQTSSIDSSSQPSLTPEPTPEPVQTPDSRVSSSPVDGAEAKFWPTSKPAEIGVTYEFALYTHCGTDHLTDFDGSFWRVTTVEQPTLGDPMDEGTMTLLTADTAEYESNGGGVLRFERITGPKVVPGCT